jgi:anaerobic ribonucleoside-triphosphate reductase activating protein
MKEKIEDLRLSPLKYWSPDTSVTFSEFPDETALCINISNCPCHCDSCSEKYLKDDIGTLLTNDEIDNLIAKHSDCTLFGLMGGDSNYPDCIRITNYIHKKYPKWKVGIYSGRDFIDLDLAQVVDVYKIGRWIMPVGDSKDWWKKNCGVLQFPFSNQLYFERVDGKLVNETQKFRKNPISNLERYIVRPDKDTK